jgi:hypothetical protein
MNRKAELEYKQLIKLGVTESLARLIIMKKYHADSEECDQLMNDEINEKKELADAIGQFSFKPLEISSSITLYDKNKNTSI